MTSYPFDRNPYVEDGNFGERCLRSAQIDREEIDCLDLGDPRRDHLVSSVRDWEKRAGAFLGSRPDQGEPEMSVFDEVIAEHTCDSRVLCGAQSLPVDSALLHPGTAHAGEMTLTCTLPYGHEPEMHRDAVHCYSFHRFVTVAESKPIVRGACKKCRTEWPCDTIRLATVVKSRGLEFWINDSTPLRTEEKGA